ncbi:MAG: hypothetical protein ACYSTF_04095, partial [Planctomycetota bacterium]
AITEYYQVPLKDCKCFLVLRQQRLNTKDQFGCRATLFFLKKHLKIQKAEEIFLKAARRMV